MSQEYLTVLHEAARSRDWATHSLLVDQGAKARCEALSTLVLVAAKNFDDDAAKNFFTFLLRAIDDVELTPLLGVLTGDKSDRLVLPDRGEALLEASRRSQCARWKRAQWAMKLLLEVPTHRTRLDDHSQPYEQPVLVGARELILKEITTWWRATDDEDQADEIYRYLLNLPRVCHSHLFSPADELVEKSIREATNQHFPFRRILKYLTLPAAETRDFIQRILAIAFVRNAEPQYLHAQLQVSGPLTDCSDAAYNLAASVTAQIARLDNDVQLLWAVLGENTAVFSSKRIKRPPEYAFVPGTLTISYSQPDTVEAALEEQSNSCHWGAGFADSEGHGWFERARGSILRWQATFPHPVNFRVVVKRGKGIIFSREQYFAVKREGESTTA